MQTTELAGVPLDRYRTVNQMKWPSPRRKRSVKRLMHDDFSSFEIEQSRETSTAAARILLAGAKRLYADGAGRIVLRARAIRTKCKAI